jgi:hypothetical protein
MALTCTTGAAGSAFAAVEDINGMNLITRNFNDFPSSTGSYRLNAGPSTPFPAGPNGHISIPTIAGDHHVDELLPFTDFGNFANRHLAFFSADGGATSYSFDFTQGFCASARVMVRTKNVAWAIGTRSIEAGFWAHVPRQDDTTGAPYTDEGGVFTVTNGTTFLGGAGLPFYLAGEGGFNNPSNPPFFTGQLAPDGFTEGWMDQTLVYVPPTPTSAARIILNVTDGVSGVMKSSGLLEIFDTVDAFGDHSGWWNPGTQLGFRFQNAPQNLTADTEVQHVVSNIKIIPAPGVAGVIGLAALAGMHRRRS